MNDKTGQIVECLEKAKLANLNVFSPNEEFDWRISVNSEVPGECGPAAGRTISDTYVQPKCSRTRRLPTPDGKTECPTNTACSRLT